MIHYSDDIINRLIVLAGEERTKYSSVVFSHNQAGIAVAHRPFQLLTSWCWYPRVDGVYDETRVSPSVVLYGIEKAGAEAGLKLIEIETWHPYKQSKEGLPNWAFAAAMWQAQTDHKIGFYRILPDLTDNYFPVVLLKRAIESGDRPGELEQRKIIAEWMRANDAHAIVLHRYYVSSLKYVLAFPGVSGVLAYSSGEPPTEYKWTDIISDVVRQTGEFGRK